MSPLPRPPAPPLYDEAGLGLGRGGEERDGHAVSPPLPVRPCLGENHQGAGAVCWLNMECDVRPNIITNTQSLLGQTWDSNYEGIFIII